jgi:hypothetical protein
MVRRGREFWAPVVAELERSGKRQADFAAKRGVKLGALQKWLYRIRREQCGGANEPRILPVRVVASTAATARWSSDRASVVEIELPSGVRLRFSTGTDGDYIATMVKRLS